MVPVETPLIWFGGKSRLAEHIHKRIPQHKCWVDLFCGGTSVTSLKEPRGIEVVNDIDGDLVNFLMVVREDPEKFAAAVETIPYSRELYVKWKWEDKPSDPFERAVRWFYLNRSAISAGNNHRSGWRHGKNVNPALDYHSAIDRLQKYAARFKNVMIENRDFREIIKTYDSDETVFYVDPPYVGNERRYKGGFQEKDHIDLADALNSIEGKAIVSFYSCDLVERLYDGWRREEFGTFTTSRVEKGNTRSGRIELLLMNWHEPQMNLFDAMEEVTNCESTNL